MMTHEMVTVDKMSVMDAYVNGARIEIRSSNIFEDDWRATDVPKWNWVQFDYRIAIEQETRPYTREELESIVPNCSWIRGKASEKLYQILIVCETSVNLHGCSDMCFQTLLNNYTWHDGTVCGVME